nr:hypothetical protein [Aeromonas media]
MLKFSVLVDDDVHLPGCLPEKGLSLLLECDGLKVLFDSGRGRALRHNAEVMAVDLGSLTLWCCPTVITIMWAASAPCPYILIPSR